jgi:hypothetical protein
MEDSVRLADPQLVLLSAASQRDDRALERPSNLTGGAAGKVVAKLLAEGLVEEIQSRGSLPVWRRDDDGPRSSWPHGVFCRGSSSTSGFGPFLAGRVFRFHDPRGRPPIFGCSRSCTGQNRHRFSAPVNLRSPEPAVGIALARRATAASATARWHNHRAPRTTASAANMGASPGFGRHTSRGPSVISVVSRVCPSGVWDTIWDIAKVAGWPSSLGGASPS